MPQPTLSLRASVTRKASPALASDMKERLALLQAASKQVAAPVVAPVAETKAEPPALVAVPTQPPVESSRKAELESNYQQLKQQLPVIADGKPLAIGVKQHLLELAKSGTLGLSCEQLVKVMRLHCGSARYLKALANDGSYRHDLDGNPVEPVSDEHRRYACQQLLELAGKRKAPYNIASQTSENSR